jgi:phospho-2-dehydro-3-deoxyheptonate aldolase
MERAGQKARLVVDCSHANSGKNWRRQGEVARAVGEQVAVADGGPIVGVMLESHLRAGEWLDLLGFLSCCVVSCRVMSFPRQLEVEFD